jgi:hypothetical protein
LNANLLRRWISESESPHAVVRANLAGATPAQPAFVGLQVARRSATPEGVIHIELQRAGTSVRIQWPVSAVSECAVWIREVLA